MAGPTTGRPCSICLPSRHQVYDNYAALRLHTDALRVYHGPLPAAAASRPRGAAQGVVARGCRFAARHPTVASLLKATDETALVGKWIWGGSLNSGRTATGFDEFLRILSGAATISRTPGARRTGGWVGARRRAGSLREPDADERAGYLTDLLSDKAVEMFGRPRTNPFFLSLQYNRAALAVGRPGDAAIDHTDHGRGPRPTGRPRRRSTARW